MPYAVLIAGLANFNGSAELQLNKEHSLLFLTGNKIN